MIFTFSEMDKGFDEIFHNRNLDINSWTSKIPSPSMNLLGDPKLIQELYGDAIYGGISYVANQYLYNNVTAARITIGKIAGTLGYLSNEFNSISNVFKEDADNITIALKTADAIINSEYFQRGLDALGAIPIVGWIIKIIVKAAELVYKIVRAVQDGNIKNVKKELSDQYSIPITEFDMDIDESLTRIAMQRVKSNDMNWLFTPRYIFEDIIDFEIRREKYDEKDEQTRFFNLTSSIKGGLGFVPGTVNINAALRFSTGACADVLDVGELYPTPRGLASSVFQMIQKPGPALFSIDPDYLTSLWEMNIYNMLLYGEASIKKGWSCFPTGIEDTDEFLCSLEMVGRYSNKRCKRKGQIGKTFKTESLGHYYGYRKYISKLFFNNKFKYNDEISLNNVKLKESVPSVALKVIKERQYAVINSLTCMYLSDDGRYISLKNDKILNKKRSENVSAVLNSSDWRRLVFWDIIDKDIRAAVYDKANKAGLNPDKPGPIEKFSTNFTMKSVLGDPKPPDPPGLIDIDTLVGKKVGKSTSSSGGGAGVAIIAAGILGGLMYAKK